MIDMMKAKYKPNKEEFVKKMTALAALAKEVGCTQAQLSLAWVLVNKDVSTAIVGATKPAQMVDNLGAIDIVKKWTPDIEKKLEAIMGNTPEPTFNWRHWQPMPQRRSVTVEYPKPA